VVLVLERVPRVVMDKSPWGEYLVGYCFWRDYHVRYWLRTEYHVR